MKSHLLFLKEYVKLSHVEYVKKAEVEGVVVFEAQTAEEGRRYMND